MLKETENEETRFFCQTFVFLLNIREDQKKKSYHLRAGPLALSHIVNPALVIALRL